MNRPLWMILCLLLLGLFSVAGCATSSDSPQLELATPTSTAPSPQLELATPTSTAPSPQLELATPTSTAPEPQLEQAPPASTAPDPQHGIAILGDSFYDEYQGSDRRGGEYAATTFNLVELLARNRGFHLGAWGDWGEPRREGYEYNWARSGATSTTLIEMGQHTGAAAQIAAGAVSFVFIGVGSNDFSPYNGSYDRIYDGSMSDEELAAKIQTAIANMTLAVDTVQQAGAQGVAMTLFMQWELDPTIAGSHPDAARRRRVADAIDAVNNGLLAMAAERGVAVVQQSVVGASMQASVDAEGFFVIGGERIDLLHHGDEPHHSRLGDAQHIGTVMGGVTANYYFIDTLNREFGLAIPRLSDEEILREAGLRP